MNGLREEQLESAHLRVRFRFGEDRFAHEIWLSDGSAWTCLLQSIEGSASDDWPASPPLQSLHLERRGDRQVALAVGMAGASHWSASVELDPLAHRARFDIACRARGAAEGRLGSAYRVLDGPPPKSPAARSAVLASGMPGESRLALKLDDDACNAALELSSDGLRVAVEDTRATADAQTIRWAYTIWWQRSGETG